MIAHPLVQHNLAKLRDKRTEPEAFRRGLGEVAALMVYEATRSFQTRTVPIQTPLLAVMPESAERRMPFELR